MPPPISWQWSWTLNAPAGGKVVYDRHDVSEDVLRLCRRIEFWYSPGPPESFAWESTILNRKPLNTFNSGKYTWTLAGPDQLTLFKSRLVNSYKGSANASKLANATDILRAWVREQCTSSAGARVWYDGLTVQGDTGEGPLLGKDAARGNLLQAIQDVVKASAEASPAAEIYFDLVRRGGGWLFITGAGAGGRDMGRASDCPNVLMADTDLTDWEWERDAEREITSVTVGGTGDGLTQPILEVTDPVRLNVPQGNRWEAWVQVQEVDEAKLRTAGQAALKPPLDRLRGTLRQGLYRRRVFKRDKFVLQRGTRLYDAVVRGVVASGANAEEKVEIRVDTSGDANG